MAATSDQPTLSFAKPAAGGAKKVYYIYSAPTHVFAAIRAGFSHLGLQHELVARSTSDSAQIVDEVREDNVGGAIVPFNVSEKLVSEAEYVDESLEEIGCINLVTKDAFQDLHVANTFKTYLTSQILAHTSDEGASKALVLGDGPVSKIAAYILQEFGIEVTTWHSEGPFHFDLSTIGSTPFTHVISSLSGDQSFPTIPDAVLGPDTLVVDAHMDEKETPLIQLAKTVKSTLVTGVELEFEATLLAFQAIVSPVGVPLAVPAPSNVMAKAFIEASPEHIKKSVPSLIAKHL